MILCIKDGDRKRFLEWSSIADAPVTEALTRAEMLRHLRQEHGKAQFDEQKRRVARAEEQGTSSLDRTITPEDVASFNRAGPEETTLTFGAIVRIYVRDERPALSESAKACVRALKDWDTGEENHDEHGNGPIVGVAIDPFATGGIEVHVTPNLVGGEACERFTLGPDDTPETVAAKLRAAKKAIVRASA